VIHTREAHAVMDESLVAEYAKAPF